jgi:ribosome-associated toxin RatA of RatAB toxin-antitoxin module
MIRTLATLVLLFTAQSASAADGIKTWSEPVADSAISWSIVEATIDAPASMVWGIVSSCNDYQRTMPSIAKARELSREGDPSSSFTTVCEVTADLPFPMSDLTSVSKAVHTVEADKRYVRRWQMMRGDYEFNEGSWTVAATSPTQTLATYRIRVRPKMPVPDSMLGSFQAATLPKIIAHLRSRVREMRAAPSTAASVAP